MLVLFNTKVMRPRKTKSLEIQCVEARNMLQWRTLGSIVAVLMALRAVSAKESVPALYVFGDSTVDTGNNNYINTTEEFRADFPPYGQDFFGKPTGRYSNGRVIVDFIAEYAGLPLIPPYLQPGADHSHGANFGSGGAGVLATTNLGLVLDFKRQLSYFLEHQAAVTLQHGHAYAENFFSEAVYLISIGSNDYLSGYLGNPEQHEKYTPEKFVHTIVTGIIEGIQMLYTQGARKIVVLGLGPIGCLAALRSLDQTGRCSEPASALATAHNDGVKGVLGGLQPMLPGLTLAQAEFFGFFKDRLDFPSKYNFEDSETPCCGAGTCAGHCGRVVNSSNKGCELCKNANAYIWWDPYHPSETVHKQFAETIWNGNSSDIWPVDIKELFKQRTRPSCADKLDLFPGDPLQQMVSESLSTL